MSADSAIGHQLGGKHHWIFNGSAHFAASCAITRCVIGGCDVSAQLLLRCNGVVLSASAECLVVREMMVMVCERGETGCRCCGVIVCSGIVELGMCEVWCLIGIFECSELTRVFAGIYVCVCGIIWWLMVF